MSGGNPEKIHPRTLDILEEEGLAPAVNTVGDVLRTLGRSKNGFRGWVAKRSRYHERKAIRHLSTEGLDDEPGGSGLPHAAHGAARALMLLGKVLRKMGGR